MPLQVPVLDMRGSEEQLVREMRRACTTSGFFLGGSVPPIACLSCPHAHRTFSGSHAKAAALAGLMLPKSWSVIPSPELRAKPAPAVRTQLIRLEVSHEPVLLQDYTYVSISA